MRFLVAFTFALAATLAQADSANDAYFRSLDLNGDGYVSLAEAAGDAVVVNRFDKGDRNRDGKLSPKEFANLKNVRVRIARKKPSKDHEGEASAAVGGTAPKPTSALKRKTKSWADGG